MTSGQSGPPPGWEPEQGSPPPYGSPGQPYGPPPGQPYGPPPGQPPYGPPPGQPYGQQWPAYMQAPPLPQPTYGGPVATERPLTVRVGLGSFIGSIVLSVIGGIVTFANFDLIMDDALAQMKPQQGVNLEVARQTAQTAAYVGVIFGLLLVAAYGMFVLFAWRGRNWARIVLWVLGGLGLAGSLLSVGGRGSPVPFLTGISGFQGLLLLVAIVALALKPSNDWFRYQGWLRATGQR